MCFNEEKFNSSKKDEGAIHLLTTLEDDASLAFNSYLPSMM